MKLLKAPISPRSDYSITLKWRDGQHHAEIETDAIGETVLSDPVLMLTVEVAQRTSETQSQSVLRDRSITMLILAAIVQKLGGEVSITQADIDDVAYNRLEEDGDGKGTVTFRVVKRSQTS